MRYTLAVVLLLALAACAAAPPSPSATLDAFKAAGLAVNNVTTDDALTPELKTAAPSCVGARFDVEGDNGGRVVVCGKEQDAQALERYYVSLGEASALFASHVERRGSLVLQMNGEIDQAVFDKYAAALPR